MYVSIRCAVVIIYQYGTTTNQHNNIDMRDYCSVHVFILLIGNCFFLVNCSPSKQLLPPEVRPFFAAGSLVEDWPSGDLFKAQAKVTLSELSFVLFYAPWSAESQHARDPYDFAAKLFYRQAYFAAINCWHPVGECRQQYTKV